jgi:hypothetical protein
VGGFRPHAQSDEAVRRDLQRLRNELAVQQRLTRGLENVADGQVVRRDGDQLVGDTTFTEAGAWLPDASPVVPSAYDDEFLGTALGSAWTELDNNSVLTPTVANGFLKYAATTHATVHVRGHHRAAPVEAEWSVWAKVNLAAGPPGASIHCGVFVAGDLITNPTTAGLVTAFVAATSATAAAAGAQRWTDFDTLNTTYQTVSWAPWGYVRIGYDGTNFTYWCSNSGLEWWRMAAVAAPFVPVRVGVFCLNSSGATTYHHIDFFRVKVGTGASGAGAGLFEGRRL